LKNNLNTAKKCL